VNKFIVDTQALVKHLVGEHQVISPAIDKILRDTDNGLNIVIIPAVVVFEIAYLHEKGRIPITVENLRQLISDASNYIEEPISIDIIVAAFQIYDIPELHDRLIAGTAKFIGAPILTNDPVIRSSQHVECVF